MMNLKIRITLYYITLTTYHIVATHCYDKLLQHHNHENKNKVNMDYYSTKILKQK